MSLPDNCIKGIKHDSYLIADGSPGAHLFYFEKQFNRDDGWCEQSINWKDDKNAINFTMNQKKENGEIQFPTGVVIIPRNELDRINNLPQVNGILSYERKKLEDNKYHGNILLKTNVIKKKMILVAANIALAVSDIIRRSEQ